MLIVLVVLAVVLFFRACWLTKEAERLFLLFLNNGVLSSRCSLWC